jgi:tRNA-modifying protein YgfZ
MPAAYLPDRGIVHVGGDDATSFLQGLVTSDVEKLGPGQARFGALLSPQGKILFDFIIVAAPDKHGGGFLLDTPRALVPDLARRLGFYKLRAKVTIEDLSETEAVAVRWGGHTARHHDEIAFMDPRLQAMGERIIAERAPIEAFGVESFDNYHAHRIRHGVPEGGKDFIYGDAFPHEADMDQLGGVDFEKGCYVGQEVVSRMEHRGTARSRIVPVVFVDGLVPPDGIDVMAGQRSLGKLGSAAQGRGLALLRLDRVADALKAGQPLMAGGLALRLEKPAWARFAFPGEDQGTKASA